jgi:hypothetical protein
MCGGTAISSRIDSTVSPFLPIKANSFRASPCGVAVLSSQCEELSTAGQNASGSGIEERLPFGIPPNDTPGKDSGAYR